MDKNEINLANVKQFDDVYVEINGHLYEGWVTEVKNNKIYVVYTNSENKLEDIIFTISRPLNVDYIVENNKVLYLNKPDYDV